MLLLSSKEMSFFDKYTIDNIGIPSLILMENAGKEAADFISERCNETDRVLIVCGMGNNGGDGLVVARWLNNYGFDCEIIIAGARIKITAETLTNLKICENLGISVLEVRDDDSWNQLGIEPDDYDVIIDALFGIGFTGEITGFRKKIIDFVNSSQAKIYALDIPSGVDADTGQANIAIIADYTLAIAAVKYGHVLGKGREFSGEIHILDIGIPGELFQNFPPRGELLCGCNIQLPERSEFFHKGDYGRVGVIAGSKGYTGAAVLACSAALRGGAGLITLFHQDDLQLNIIFETSLREVMTFPVNFLPDINCLTDFLNKLEQQDVLLIGPGIGQADAMILLVKYLLENWKKPMIIDADALNIISRNKFQYLLKGKDFLLTPHPGEFSRLSGLTLDEIDENVIQNLTKFTDTYETSVLLKGHTSIFADNENLLLNVTGNDALATGGSGDVLAGLIAAFTAQGQPFSLSAPAAAYVLGKTAEYLSENRSTASIIPTDIIQNLLVNETMLFSHDDDKL